MNYIPKVIHMIWFGNGIYPENTKKCLESWKKNCPDYQIVLWNEDNCDLNENNYVREAASVQKWAFVSDYFRLKILYEYGGVYIDTDVEILKPIDEILNYKHVVTGYATANMISSGFIAAERKNIWIKSLLDYYNDRHFIREDGSFDIKINNLIISQLSKELGLKLGESFCEYGNVTLMPRRFFQPYTSYPINWYKDRIEDWKRFYDIDQDTYCIHYCAASWNENRGIATRVKHIVRRSLPKEIIDRLEMIYYWKRNWKA